MDIVLQYYLTMISITNMMIITTMTIITITTMMITNQNALFIVGFEYVLIMHM